MQRLEDPVPSREIKNSIVIGKSPYAGTTVKPDSSNVTFNGERFVGIRNVNALPPFLMSIVSNGNLWLFAASNSPFTAGRGDPTTPLFPYRTADKVLSQPAESGARSVFLVERETGSALWEPWQSAPGACRIRRNLFKSEFGTSVIFEEISEDLGLRFAWKLTTSDTFGLVRCCTLENMTADTMHVRYLDGWNQILPAGVGQDLFEKYSYLAAAYMRHECQRGFGIFTLNSAVSDRAEPCESLRAAAAWSLGHANPTVLLCERQLEKFRRGRRVKAETEVRGEFGAYFGLRLCRTEIRRDLHEWVTVADTGLDHAALAKLQNQLGSPAALKKALVADVPSDARRFEAAYCRRRRFAADRRFRRERSSFRQRPVQLHARRHAAGWLPFSLRRFRRVSAHSQFHDSFAARIMAGTIARATGFDDPA